MKNLQPLYLILSYRPPIYSIDHSLNNSHLGTNNRKINNNCKHPKLTDNLFFSLKKRYYLNSLN